MREEPRVRLDERFTHVVTAGNATILVEDEDARVLEHPLARAVLGMLDGRWTALDIARELEDDHPPAVVHYLLLHLLDAGVAREVVGGAGDDGDEPEGALARALADAWARGGAAPWVAVPPAVWTGPSGTRLLLTADYLAPGLDAAAGEARGTSGAPILLGRLTARRLWLGPVLAEDASCGDCLRDRLRLNLTGRSLVHLPPDARRDFSVSTLPNPVPGSLFSLLAGHLPTGPEELEALECTLSVEEPGAPGPRRHPVPRLPHCPTCGDPTRTVPGARVTLRSRPHTPASGGGYRIVSPQETLDRYAPLVSPLVGVVRRVERVAVDGLGLVQAFTASHAHHYGTGNVRAVKDDRRDHSGGKGRTEVDARASALCESLERFSAVHRGGEPSVLARFSELGARAYPPNDLMHFSEKQYAGRSEWNASQRGGFQSVPQPYTDQEIEWSPVRDLGSGEERLVPAAFVYYGFQGRGRPFCDGDSNGLAGGNCLEEAILQGFLELVERDAIALWWYNRALRPGVFLDEAADPWIGEVKALYEGLGRDLWALDLTTDLGIPTFAALSAVRREREQDIIFGFGSHFDAGIALTRALSEVNQMLPTVLQSREERRARLLPDFTDALTWWDEATLDGAPYLRPDPARTRLRLPTEPPAGGNLLDDIRTCVARAAAVGCDVLVHDLTRPDVGFPVAKVIVPGLRHFWRRLGPGRLFDAPVRMGWVERAPSEDDLNPVSMFV